MVDAGWLYTLIQGAATFVAIVGAFFTTKVLSVSSEMRSLRNRLKLVKAEMDHREGLMRGYQEEMDVLEAKWAKQDVGRFLERKKRDLLAPIPTLGELQADYKKLNSLNRFESRVLEDEFPKFLEALRMMKERGAGTPGGHIPAHIGVSLLRGDERKAWNESFEKWEAESDALGWDKARFKELEAQLSGLAYPPYIKLGFLVLVYFGSTSVLLPLFLAPSLSVIDSNTFEEFFLLFLSGFTLTFVYLYFEISTALKG
jgi:hypothetical protein